MTCLEGFHPARGKVFIRHVETEETYAGSPIIIPDQARDRVAKHQFIVVSVGDYARCEDPDECNRPHTVKGEHRHYLKVGDWILARNRSWGHTPDPDVFVLNQDDVLGVFQEG